MNTRYVNQSEVLTIVEGLQRAGYPVRGGNDGDWLTTTVICHGGDSLDKLAFGPRGVVCSSHKPCEGATWAALRAAAGVAVQDTDRGVASQERRRMRPQFDTGRQVCPGCGTDGLMVDLIPGTGWPALRCDCGATYDTLLEAFASKEWTAWAEYWLADGRARYMLRPYPSGRGKSKTTWARELDEKGDPVRRRAQGLTPLVWGQDAPENVLIILPGEKAAAALASAGIAGYTPVSTTADTGMANANYALVDGRRVIIWADADNPKVHTRTGAPIKISVDYAQLAVPRIYLAGATSVALVNTDTIQTAVPPGGKKDGADAADIPPSLFAEVLGAAMPVRAPSTAPAGPQEPIPWWIPEDFVGKWEDTPDADCARTMRHYAGDLLVIQPNGGGPMYLRAQSAGGIWGKADAEIDRMVDATARGWATSVVNDPLADANGAARVARWQKRTAARGGRNTALESVGAVYSEWRHRGVVPVELTYCHESMLDANPRYLGAQNGVIDLHTGQLLTGDAARACRVTRAVPGDYNPDATHPAIDQITSHLNHAERDYILSAMGYALRGNPGRRFYLLYGPTNGGKTTLLTAVLACLGDVQSVGYGLTLADDALLQSRGQSAHAHKGGLFGIQDARLAAVSELPDGGGRFNVGLVKLLDGVGLVSIRDVGEKAGLGRPATATIFVAVNPLDMDRLVLTDTALLDRIRILPYPQIPEDRRSLGFAVAVRTNPAAHQAMLAVLVRYAVANPEPPANIPSVAQAVEDRRQESIGGAGVWLQSRVVHAPGYRLAPGVIWDTVSKAFPPDDKGQIENRNRQGIVALARELCQLPPQKQMRIDGRSTKGYENYRLLTDAEVEALVAEQGARVCIQCREDVGDAVLNSDGLCLICAKLTVSAAVAGVAEANPEVIAEADLAPATLERAVQNIRSALEKLQGDGPIDLRQLPLPDGDSRALTSAVLTHVASGQTDDLRLHIDGEVRSQYLRVPCSICGDSAVVMFIGPYQDEVTKEVQQRTFCRDCTTQTMVEFMASLELEPEDWYDLHRPQCQGGCKLCEKVQDVALACAEEAAGRTCKVAGVSQETMNRIVAETCSTPDLKLMVREDPNRMVETVYQRVREALTRVATEGSAIG